MIDEMSTKIIINLIIAHALHLQEGDPEGMDICANGIIDEVSKNLIIDGEVMRPSLYARVQEKWKELSDCPHCKTSSVWECPEIDMKTMTVSVRCWDCAKSWEVKI